MQFFQSQAFNFRPGFYFYKIISILLHCVLDCGIQYNKMTHLWHILGNLSCKLCKKLYVCPVQALPRNVLFMMCSMRHQVTDLLAIVVKGAHWFMQSLQRNKTLLIAKVSVNLILLLIKCHSKHDTLPHFIKYLIPLYHHERVQHFNHVRFNCCL